MLIERSLVSFTYTCYLIERTLSSSYRGAIDWEGGGARSFAITVRVHSILKKMRTINKDNENHTVGKLFLSALTNMTVRPIGFTSIKIVMVT